MSLVKSLTIGGGVLPGTLKEDGVAIAMFPDETVIRIGNEADPGEPVVNGISIAKNSKIIICRSYDGPVLDPNRDVLQVIDFKPSIYLVFNEEVGKHRYYSFFIQTSQGIHGEPLLIDFDGVGKNDLRMGMFLINKVAHPNGRIIRTGEKHSDANPAPNNFYYNNIHSVFADSMNRKTAILWNYFLSHILKNYPAAVNDDGTVRYWLDPTDYRKKIDGSESDWNNPDFDGNFCAWIGKYFLELQNSSTNYPENRITYRYGYPRDGLTMASFCDWNERELEGFWLSIMPYRDLTTRPILTNTYGDCMMDKTKTFKEHREMFQGLPENDRRVPFDFSSFRQLAEILQWQTRSCDSQGIFEVGSRSATDEDLFIGFESENRIGSVVLPGFIQFPFGRAFHSTAFGCMGINMFITDSTRLPGTTSNLDNKTHYALLDPMGKVARISDESYYNCSVIWYNYTNAYTAYKTIRFLNPYSNPKIVLNTVFPTNVITTNVTPTNLTYNCDSMDLRYGNEYSAGEYPLIVRQGMPSPNGSSDGGTKTGSGVNSLIGHSHKISEIIDYATIFPYLFMHIKVLPQPGYDPFEATNYHPWEDEADNIMKEMGYK